MFNIENHGIISGRLTAEPFVFDNSDGSRKIRINLASRNNYRNKDGSRGAQFIPLESFLPARRARKGNGVFDLMHIGDKITVSYTVKNNNYTDSATGQPVYGLVLQIETVKLDESKATTAARQAARTSGNEAEKSGTATTVPEAPVAESKKSAKKAA